MLVKIEQVKTRPYSKDGVQVRLPKMWQQKSGVKTSDFVFVYRDTRKPELLILSATELTEK